MTTRKHGHRWDCRSCGAPLDRTFVDLGTSPPCEDFLTADRLSEPETSYPLRVYTCTACLLVQLPAHVEAEEVFDDYAYFSSFSDSWVAHARTFVEHAVERLRLGADSLVVEVASNDGYLLQHVVAAGIPALGVEAADNVAQAARDKGIPTTTCYLDAASGRRLAEEHGGADLVVGNNVLAHVPDLNGFVAGLRALVRADGWVSLEFPHLLRLVERRQYDTIYHEHFSYFSLRTASDALARGGLSVVDVQELQTHGGSLRVWCRPTETASGAGAEVARVLEEERAAGLHTVEGHDGFERAVFDVKQGLLRFLLDARRDGRSVAGYGAPGKGNTLLNHCGVRADLLPYTVDRNPYKHGRFLPGSHIPVLPPEELDRRQPDYVLLLPWNLKDELAAQLAHVRGWGDGSWCPSQLWSCCHDRRRNAVKVVLFAGGRGLRMRDGAADVPKPLSVLAGRPLLWHVMSWYAAYGHTDFVVCLGYRADDVVRVMQEHASPDWDVSYVDTGLDTPIGQRLVAVRELVEQEDVFFANYADLLTDLPLDDMLSAFVSSGATASMLVVRPQASFHLVELSTDDRVERVGPVTHAPMWQNGGFFVMRPEVFDVIEPGEDLVDEPLGRLAAAGRLVAYRWEGFWAPLDTQKDRQRLQELHASGQTPWVAQPPRSGLLRTAV